MSEDELLEGLSHGEKLAVRWKAQGFASVARLLPADRRCCIHPYGPRFHVQIGRPGKRVEYTIDVHQESDAQAIADAINAACDRDRERWLECALHDCIADGTVKA